MNCFIKTFIMLFVLLIPCVLNERIPQKFNDFNANQMAENSTVDSDIQIAKDEPSDATACSQDDDVSSELAVTTCQTMENFIDAWVTKSRAIIANTKDKICNTAISFKNTLANGDEAIGTVIDAGIAKSKESILIAKDKICGAITSCKDGLCNIATDCKDTVYEAAAFLTPFAYQMAKQASIAQVSKVNKAIIEKLKDKITEELVQIVSEPEFEEAMLLIAKEPIQKTVVIEKNGAEEAKKIDPRRVAIIRSLVQAVLDRKSGPIGQAPTENAPQVVAAPIIIANQVAVDATQKQEQELEEDEIMLHIKKIINRAGLGELALQKLLYLLDLEMVVINHLLAGQSGHILVKALEKRNKAMECAGSSVLRIYYEIMDKAADNTNTSPDLEAYIETNGSEKIQAALNRSKKERFLMHLLQVVTEYYRKIQQLLYDII